MREIKFRANRFGSMFNVVEWCFEGKQDILLRDKDGNELREWIKNLEIMQYTGLKDKNDKEIYEGDIVKAKHTTVPVWWSDELARWEMSNPKDFEDYIVHNGEDYEVIGNIHENPELLNKGSE